MCFYGRCHLAATPFFLMGFFREVFLFDTKKEPKKCPLLPIAREARPRGCSPLGTPIMWSENAKAKKCRSAAFFLTPLRPLPIDPSGVKRNSMRVELKAPLCKGGSADRRWGIVTLPIHRTTAQGYNHSAPAGHPLTRRAPLSLRDISPHCGESPFTQGRLCGAMQASPPTLPLPLVL